MTHNSGYAISHRAAHVVTTRRTYKDKVYCTHLLRRSYREDGKVSTKPWATCLTCPMR